MLINSQQSLTLSEVPKRPGVINCASYAQGVRVANVVIADISEELKHEDRFVWVGLFEPDETLLCEIQEEFCLHDLAIEDAHDAHQRPIVSLSCCAPHTWSMNTHALGVGGTINHSRALRDF